MRWLLAALVALAAPPQDTPLESVPLRPDITLIRGGGGGNVLALTTPDGVLLVDAREAAVGPALLAALGPAADRVRVVVNTHYHEDHTGGNALFPGAVRVAHAAVPAEARKDTTITLLEWHREPLPEAAMPDRLVAGDTAFTLGGQRVGVLHVPAAHTSGDLMVWLPDADVLHMGDTYELGAYPFLDLWAGGTMPGMIDAVDRALAIVGPNTAIVPGHGPASDRDALLAYRDMLVTVRNGVRDALDRGLSLDSTMALGITAPFDGRSGSARGGRRFVGLTYLSLGGHP